MGAMPEEIEGVINLATNKKEFIFAGRTYYQGYINNTKVVIVISGWGKVSAAVTANTLIQTFGVSEIIFTGVAGAIHPALRIGDVVIGKRLVQHDMDARPLIPQFQIYSLQKIFMETHKDQLQKATAAVNNVLEHLDLEIIKEFCSQKPTLHIGDIASGDQFFSSQKQKENLLSHFPTILCVEMEGASVSQVCCEYDIPFTIIRTISDQADESSPVDFLAFMDHVAKFYAVEVVKQLLQGKVESL